MRDAPVLHLFGGKGGAGKTTLASAFALTLSDANPKENVLLVTSEVTHGLSDVWRKKLTGKPTRLVQGKGEAGLSALEFELATVQTKVDAVRAALAAAAPKGLLLGEEDVGKLVSGVVPGLEPLFGLLAVVAQIEPGKLDRLVVDMAGTGPTLRLFDTATMLRRAIALVRGEKPAAKKKIAPPGDTPLDQLVAELDAGHAEGPCARLHLVAQAEPVGRRRPRPSSPGWGRGIAEIVVNAVEGAPRRPSPVAGLGRHVQVPDPTNCSGQSGRPAGEAPRGLEGLRPFAKEIAGGRETKPLEFSAAEGPPALVRAPSMPPIAAPPLPPTRLIFFVGQGGVGKSSCAAAAAVTLTEKEGPVLLISVDPAHGLSDVLTAEPAHRHRDPGEGHQGPLRPRARHPRVVQRRPQAMAGKGRAGLRVVREAGGRRPGGAPEPARRGSRGPGGPGGGERADRRPDTRKVQAHRGGPGGLGHHAAAPRAAGAGQGAGSPRCWRC
jgi:arsenite-transporting ATPase